MNKKKTKSKTKKKTSKKSTKLEKKAKVQALYLFIAENQYDVTRQQILHHVTKFLKWKLKPRQIDNYIKDTYKLISADLEEDRTRLKAVSFARYQQIFDRALKSGDLSSAIKAQHRVDKLYGLEDPERQRFVDDENNDRETAVVVFYPKKK